MLLTKLREITVCLMRTHKILWKKEKIMRCFTLTRLKMQVWQHFWVIQLFGEWSISLKPYESMYADPENIEIWLYYIEREGYWRFFFFVNIDYACTAVRLKRVWTVGNPMLYFIYKVFFMLNISLLITVVFDLTSEFLGNFSVYKGQLKSLYVDQNTLIECDQTRFIFQHCLLCSPHTSYIDVVMLGSHLSKKLTADMAYELFSLPSSFNKINRYLYDW